MSDHWREIGHTETLAAWVETHSGGIIAIAQPAGYDYWVIYDSTNTVVEGRSLGPFDSVGRAVDRIQRNVSEFPGDSGE